MTEPFAKVVLVTGDGGDAGATPMVESTGARW